LSFWYIFVLKPEAKSVSIDKRSSRNENRYNTKCNTGNEI